MESVAFQIPLPPIDILAELKKLAAENKVRRHPFLKQMKTMPLSMDALTIIIQQYWHPIHHFTEFLPATIAVAQSIPMRTYVSKILWQELGEGDPSRAHEALYLDTMAYAGISPDDVRSAMPLPATERLVAGYRKSVSGPISAIGFLYGTEVIDLSMVSAIGAAVRTTTGHDKLPWVDIHLKQEPDHVASADGAASSFVGERDQKNVISSAHELWMLWNDFYLDIQAKISRLQ